MAAAVVVKGSPQPSILSYPVDLRRRMVPPLSDYSVGNIVWKVITHYDGDAAGEDIGVSGLLGLLRTAMERSRNEFVPKLCSNVGSEAICESLEDSRVTCCNKNLNPYRISSWCRIGFTEVDFGWGKPVWLSQTGSNAARPADKNVILLMDKSDKIEAWLILSHPEMAALQLDSGFLAFATPNPPISTSS